MSLRASASTATPSSSSAPAAWGVAGTAVAVSALGLALRNRTSKAGKGRVGKMWMLSGFACVQALPDGSRVSACR